MSPGSRLLWGSLLGALLVLLIHPATGPFYRLFFNQLGPSRVLSTSPDLLANVLTVGQPRDKRSAAFFLLIASRELSYPYGLNAREAGFAEEVARKYSEIDQDNAFWPQMATVFARASGDSSRQSAQWLQASKAARWDDGQTQRLLFLSRELESEFGSDLAWQKAALAQARSDVHATAIAGVARTLRPDDPADTEVRLASLYNGQLMLEGARSMSIGAVGIQIMREASFSGRELPSASYAQNLRQRQAFLNLLSLHDGPQTAAIVDSLYRNADSWTAVVNHAGNREDRRNRELLATLAASLPGPFVYLALSGCLIWIAGWVLRFHKISHWLFSYPVAPVLGLIAGVIVFLSTHLIWPSLWAVLSLAFFVFQPAAIRSVPVSRLTPQHRILTCVVGAIFSLCFVMFVMGLGAPMRAMCSSFGVPIEYQAGSAVLLGLCLLMLSIVVFSAPVWALILRFDAVSVLRVALKEVGKGLLLAGVIGSVVSAPLSVWLDRSVADPISKTLLNEPNLYLSE
ncbi:MAG: hypothetical protein IT205_07815 [Fimbriimonadaceae bacterium]|nr:hypothetical protein [Fimbriimonadaceae bacterium]